MVVRLWCARLVLKLPNIRSSFVLSVALTFCTLPHAFAQTEALFYPADQDVLDSLDLPPLDGLVDEQRQIAAINNDWISNSLLELGSAGQLPEPVELELPDKSTITLISEILVASSTPNGTRLDVWSGSVSDFPLSRFTFVGDGSGGLIGDVIVESHTFRVRRILGEASGVYQILKPRIGNATIGAASPLSSTSEGREEPAPVVLEDLPPDYKSVIDIAVLYTENARSSAPAYMSGDIEDEIALAVAEINISFRKQGIPAELNLVLSRQIDFDDGRPINLDSSDGLVKGDLGAIIDPTDGIFDKVHTIRADANADLVSVWVSAPRNSACGQASIYKGGRAAGAARGFSIVSVYCAKRFNTFAHEVGHNLGAGHDGDESTGRFGDSRGYVSNSLPNTANVATISSRSYACQQCFRTIVWSDPSYRMGGLTWGEANTSDNRRTLSESVSDVASFSEFIDSSLGRPQVNVAIGPEFLADEAPTESGGKVIDILVVAPEQMDPQEIATSLSDLNSSFGSIDSALSVSLAALYRSTGKVVLSDFSETPAFLDSLIDENDGHFDDLPALRLIHEADLVVVVVDEAPNCGSSWQFSGLPDRAYAFVSLNCLKISFAHQFGHLLGAGHEEERTSTLSNPSLARGFSNPDEGWFTIMSYGRDCPQCEMRAIWSGTTVDSRAAGTDNASIVRENFSRVAAYSDLMAADMSTTLEASETESVEEEGIGIRVIAPTVKTPPAPVEYPIERQD